MRFPRGGFTLLELLVAMSLLAMGLVAVLEAISKGLTAARTLQDYHLAVQLARMQMNHTLTLPALPYGVEEGDFGELYPGFRWRTEVEALGTGGQDDLARVVVIVSWQQGGIERAYRLETLWSEGLRDTLLGNATVNFDRQGGAGTGGLSGPEGMPTTAGTGGMVGLPSEGLPMGGTGSAPPLTPGGGP